LLPYSVDVERPREGLLDLLSNASVVICNSDYCDAVLSSREDGGGADDDGDENRTNKDDDDDDRPVSVAVVARRLREVMRRQAPNAVLAIQTLGSRGSCLIRCRRRRDEDGRNRDGNNSATGNNKKNAQGAAVAVVLGDENESNVPVVTEHLVDDADKDDVDGGGGVPFLHCTAFGGCRVVDTTGAGDAFQGGFLTALWSYAAAAAATTTTSSSSTRSLPVPTDTEALARALRVATRVAAKKLSQPGARSGLPTAARDDFLRSELDALLSLAGSSSRGKKDRGETTRAAPEGRLD